MALNLSAALAAFSKQITIRDVAGSYVDHEWVEEEAETRTIRAVVLQMNLEQLEILGLGDISDGAISIQTRAELFFSDRRNPGMESRQSYALYDGYEYRVVSTGSTLGNANFRLYTAVRHHDAKNHD